VEGDVKKGYLLVVGAKMKKLRRICGLDQVEVMRAMGYSSTSSVSQIEKGIKGMAFKRLESAAELFGVPAVVIASEKDYTLENLEMIKGLYTIIDRQQSGDTPQNYHALKDLIKITAK